MHFGLVSLTGEDVHCKNQMCWKFAMVRKRKAPISSRVKN